MAKSVRSFIKVLNLVCYDIRTYLDIVPTNIGNIEVAPGGCLEFCLRFPVK